MSKTAHDFSAKDRTSDVLNKENVDVDFASLLLSTEVLKGLSSAGFERPSPIQLKAIPLGRCGLDLIVQAKSGTGKTCVFSVVILESLDLQCPSVQALVLAPTREIATQVQGVIRSIGCAIPSLRCHAFIGGTLFGHDRQKLKKCHVAVGTPGRVKQLMEYNAMYTESIRLLVLDEADKLLDEKFQDQINWIYNQLPVNKQMIALSATYPEALANGLTAYMRDPVFVRLDPRNVALKGITQFYKVVPGHVLHHKAFRIKVQHLLVLFNQVSFSQCLVFSNLSSRAQNLSDILCEQGWPSTYISGGQDQKQRQDAMSVLKAFQCRVLISTDLTARGIDAENVNLIVNLDVPADGKTYLHRVGRAGRFGSKGAAVTLVSEGDEETLLRNVQKQCRLQLQVLPDPVPSNLVNIASCGQNDSSTDGINSDTHDTRSGSNNQDSTATVTTHAKSAVYRLPQATTEENMCPLKSTSQNWCLSGTPRIDLVDQSCQVDNLSGPYDNLNIDVDFKIPSLAEGFRAKQQTKWTWERALHDFEIFTRTGHLDSSDSLPHPNRPEYCNRIDNADSELNTLIFDDLSEQSDGCSRQPSDLCSGQPEKDNTEIVCELSTEASHTNLDDIPVGDDLTGPTMVLGQAGQILEVNVPEIGMESGTDHMNHYESCNMKVRQDSRHQPEEGATPTDDPSVHPMGTDNEVCTSSFVKEEEKTKIEELASRGSLHVPDGDEDPMVEPTPKIPTTNYDGACQQNDESKMAKNTTDSGNDDPMRTSIIPEIVSEPYNGEENVESEIDKKTDSGNLAQNTGVSKSDRTFEVSYSWRAPTSDFVDSLTDEMLGLLDDDEHSEATDSRSGTGGPHSVEGGCHEDVMNNHPSTAVGPKMGYVVTNGQSKPGQIVKPNRTVEHFSTSVNKNQSADEPIPAPAYDSKCTYGSLPAGTRIEASQKRQRPTVDKVWNAYLTNYLPTVDINGADSDNNSGNNSDSNSSSSENQDFNPADRSVHYKNTMPPNQYRYDYNTYYRGQLPWWCVPPPPWYNPSYSASLSQYYHYLSQYYPSRYWPYDSHSK